MTGPASSQPAIPVANLLRIAFYAGDLLDELEDCEVAREDGAAFIDVLAAMLVRAASRIRLHGFERGYRAEEEITSRPRGRMLFGSSIATALLVSRRIHCTFDDFVTDTPHNRLLKATACRLLAGRGSDRGTPEDECELLRGLIREMRDIADVRLDRRLLRSLPRTPSSRRYRVVRFIARLLVDAGQPDGTLGDEWARRLLRDEKRMRRVFERFVRRFGQVHAPDGVRVGRRKLAWSDRTQPLVGGLETDITVRGRGWTRVIECKYTAKAVTRGRHGVEAYSPEHLRQLYAYLARTRDSARSPGTLEGVLLYPALDGGARHEIDLGGFPATVQRLSLANPWSEITRGLVALVDPPRFP